MSTALVGTAPLLRTSLRHDGRMFGPWVTIVTLLSASSVIFYPYVFPTQQDREAYATAVGSNPAVGLIFGPAFDLSTVDGFNAWRALALGGFLTALGAIFAVTRATRAQEDSGRAELLASGVLGRSSRLAAGVGVALVGSTLTGVVSGAVTALSGGGWHESMLLAATFTATGWMFAAVAAVTAQIAADARTANSLAVGTLGTLFMLRGFSYSIDAPDWTIWANPLGWMTETRPASGNYWWPLLPALGLTLALLVVAFAFQSRRDFGQGALAPRPGPARGRVRSPWGLALRLNRGPIVTWAIAFTALGVVFGYFTASIHEILAQNSTVAAFLAAGAVTHEALVSQFLVMILSLGGIIASVSGVQTMLKVRSEEMEDRVEPLIASSLPRARFYAAHVILAFALSALNVLIAGTIIGLVASRADIGVEFGNVVLQTLAIIPAVWTVVGVSIAVVGARPHVSLAAWAGVLMSFTLTLLGPMFNLWDWILGINPYWHVPNVTDADPDWSGLLWISLVTVLFLVIGFVGFRRRDLARQ